jgi:1-deoxy-D-xylulose-5-phosphate synthase
VLEEYARKCRVLCTFEDHALLNGFGAGVIEHLHSAGILTPVERIGWPDEFIEHGKPDILRELHGLTPESAVAKVTAHLGN